MAQYDEIVKHLMHQYADEFAMLSFGTPDVQVFRVFCSILFTIVNLLVGMYSYLSERALVDGQDRFLVFQCHSKEKVII